MKIRPHKFTSVVSRLALDPEISYSRRVEAKSGQVLHQPMPSSQGEIAVHDQLIAHQARISGQG